MSEPTTAAATTAAATTEAPPTILTPAAESSPQPPGTPPETPPTEGAAPPAPTPTVKPPATPPGEPIKLELPQDSLLHPDDFQALQAWVKEKKVAPELAKELLIRESNLARGFHERNLKTLEERSAEWVEQIKADAEIGGGKFEASTKAAHKAINAFASPELRQILRESGLGNHPELVRLFAKVGEAMQDDATAPPGGAPPPPQQRQADILYGVKK